MWNGANLQKQQPPCGWDTCKRMQVGHRNYILCSQEVYMKVLVCNDCSTRSGMLGSWWDSLESEHWHSFMGSHTIGGKVKMKVAQSCLALWDPRGCSPPGSTVCGILQARILEWVAIRFSRQSSQARNQSGVSRIAGRIFTIWTTREVHTAVDQHQNQKIVNDTVFYRLIQFSSVFTCTHLCVCAFCCCSVLSHVWLFVTPWTAARQASLSFTISRNLLKLISIELVMPSNHQVLSHSRLHLPSIFPSIRVFSNEWALCIRWPKYWSISFSINTSNEYSRLTSFRVELFDSHNTMYERVHVFQAKCNF